MIYKFLSTLYNSKYMKETTWSLPYYLLLITVSMVLMQFLFIYFGSMIPTIVVFNISVIIITISFLVSIYYENVTNKKRTKKIGIYVNEIEKLKNYILNVLIYAFSILNVFLSYSIIEGINKTDIISIAFILSITFIPILYMFISKIKSTFYELKSRIKENIYKDDNIKTFYSKMEIDSFVALYLTNFVYVKGNPNSTFEDEISILIYEELKKGNCKKIKKV